MIKEIFLTGTHHCCVCDIIYIMIPVILCRVSSCFPGEEEKQEDFCPSPYQKPIL